MLQAGRLLYPLSEKQCPALLSNGDSKRCVPTIHPHHYFSSFII